MNEIPVREDVIEWVTPGEAAASLGVTPKTVSRIADQGEIRSFRPTGKHRRYAAVDIEAIIARGQDD